MKKNGNLKRASLVSREASPDNSQSPSLSNVFQNVEKPVSHFTAYMPNLDYETAYMLEEPNSREKMTMFAANALANEDWPVLFHF